MPLDLNSPEVDQLVRILEEATRATSRAVSRFIEPARGTLDRAKSRRHHIVFGRRGSGKTSLLRKAEADLSLDRKPTAYVDLETFKGHSYPDVLLSVLIAAIDGFRSWLESAGAHPKNKLLFWLKRFGRKPAAPPISKHKRAEILSSLATMKRDLEALLFAQDNAHVTTTESTASESSIGGEIKAQLPAPFSGVGASAKADSAQKVASETKEESLRSKIDFLHRSILRFQHLAQSIAQLSDGSAFLVLDDLYHIRREDQAAVLDYFHRIAKNSGLWIKVGSIRHRTDHYRHGNPPVGVKLGDDADDIDLDITLEKYDIAKTFLCRVLDGLLHEAGIANRDDILSDTAIDRLVLASGGVARDFLTILRRAIDCARERGDDARGPRIGAEDVNRASGEHDTSKRDELRRDAADDTSQIETAFATIRDFCLVTANANCFLVERDIHPGRRFVLDELVDLKMLHLVQSRVTIPDRPGTFYIAYMLDLSQYAGDRKRRNLDLIPFWDQSARDRLRKVGLLFDLMQLNPGKEAGSEPTNANK